MTKTTLTTMTPFTTKMTTNLTKVKKILNPAVVVVFKGGKLLV